MPLDEKDEARVAELVAKTLGIKEGQSFAEMMGESINGLINRYDKSKGGEAKKAIDSLREEFGSIKEALEKATSDPTKTGGDPGDPGIKVKPDGSLDISGVQNAALKEVLSNILAASKKSQDEAAAFRKERDEERAARQKREAEQAERDLTDAIRAAAIADGVNIDPKAVDQVAVLVKAAGLVRKREAGDGYEMVTGRNEITSEPQYGAVDAGMKNWAKANPRFVSANPGGGPNPPKDDNKTRGSVQLPDDFSGMSAKEIREKFAPGAAQ